MNVNEARRIRDQVWPEAMKLLPAKLDTKAAMGQILATGFQETKFEARAQIIKVRGFLRPAGPARSYFQMEQGGGINGVLTNRATRELAEQACAAYKVPPITAHVWECFGYSDYDTLAVVFARLLYWADAAPLPQYPNRDAAYAYYKRNWRPGKERPDEWKDSYDAGWELVNAQ